jgi:hypothetical protein
MIFWKFLTTMLGFNEKFQQMDEIAKKIERLIH